jgi:aspartate aminotransferase-like enzyme
MTIMQRTLNMSCGQTSLYPECQTALGEQIYQPIYYPEYWATEIAVVDMLREICHTHNDVLLMAGSATYGEEAAMLSLLEPHEKVLTVNSGMYGQVLTELAGIVGAQAVEIKIKEGDAVRPDAIRRKLESDREIKMVAAVYADTSQGSMNPVAEIGEMLQDFPNVLFMVDAVSALTALELRIDDWRIDVCCTSPQKCVNAPQGLAIVVAGDRVWKKIESRRTPIHSLCLDLGVWKEYHDGVRAAFSSGRWQDISTVTTKAIHGPSPSYTLVRGLKASLEAILKEGLENVYHRHRIAAKAVREAVRALGLQVKAGESVAAPMTTTLVFPRPMDWTAFSQKMLEEHGIAIAAGFRIGNMGLAADPRQVIPTIAALEQTLRSMGWDVELGAGIRAAESVFAEDMKQHRG